MIEIQVLYKSLELFSATESNRMHDFRRVVSGFANANIESVTVNEGCFRF